MKNSITEEKLIVLFREMTFEKFQKSVAALHKAGVKILEICFNAKDVSDGSALEKIAYVKNNYDDISVGAGTVISPEQVIKARNAGAEFIVSPVCDESVIRETKKCEMISIAGAYTPTECFNAYKAGADFVKLFPLKEENISYFNTIKTPLPAIKFIATGGVNEDNVKRFLDSGLDAVGTGVSILKSELIEQGEFEKIYELAKKHVEAAKGIRRY